MTISLPEYSRFADLLRFWRGENTINVARTKLGISFATFKNWEQGATTPKPRDAAHLADVMALPIELIRNLVTDDKSPANPPSPEAA